jgi:hypothetical protein
MANSLNLLELNQEASSLLLEFYIKNKQNCFVFGKKGIGKTAIVKQVADKLKYNLIYINLSVLERVDLAGYPDFTNKSDVVKFKQPFFLPKISSDESNSILFFDEADKAPIEITAPLLELLQFKSINSTKINISSCILTGNLPEENAYSNALSSALLDRGAKFIIKFDFNKWFSWASGTIHPLILSFLYLNQDLVTSSVDIEYATPSPRGWDFVSKSFFEIDVFDIDLATNIVASFVGNTVANKFNIWYRFYQENSSYVEDFLNNKPPKAFKKWEQTKQFVFLMALANAIKVSNKKINNFCDFLEENNVPLEMVQAIFSSNFSIEYVVENNLHKNLKFKKLAEKLKNKIKDI